MNNRRSLLSALFCAALIGVTLMVGAAAQPDAMPTALPQTVEAEVARRLADPVFEATVSAALSAAQTATAAPSLIVPAVTPRAEGEVVPRVEIINGVEMAYVPAGSFLMGSSYETVELNFADCEAAIGAGSCDYEWFSREAPPTEITFGSPFWIDVTEVTNTEYARCVDAGACSPPEIPTAYDDPALAQHPVVGVSWGQAVAYAEWRGGRLPSEAEWEYAARGADAHIYPWGDDFDPASVNFCDLSCIAAGRAFDVDDSFATTAPVGSFPSGASWVGALDMAGNVGEWTRSIYDSAAYPYPYNPLDGRELLDNGMNDARVYRGGGWNSVPRDLRAANRRVSAFPMPGDNAIGLRVVMDVQP